jgi:hypothetical protein
MAQNEVLYQLRMEKGLSLAQASKQSHVPFVFLYLYENGYFHIWKKHLTRLAAFYEQDPSVFADPKGYPNPLFPKLNAQSFLGKMAKVFYTWPAFFVSLFLFLVSISLIITGWHYTDVSKRGIATLFGEDYKSLVSYTIANGVSAVDDTSQKVTAYKVDDTHTLAIDAYVSPDYLNRTTFYVTLPRDASTLTFTYTENQEDLWFYFTDNISGTYTYQGYGYIDNQTYTLAELADPSNSNVTDQAIIDQESAKLVNCYQDADAIFAAWKTSAGLTFSSTFGQILANQGKGNSAIYSLTMIGNNLMMIPSLLGAAFLFTTLFFLWGINWRKKNKEMPVAMTQAPENLYHFNGVLERRPEPHKELSKNWPLTTFIPETALRLIGIGIFLASSILLFQMSYALRTGNIDIFAITNQVQGFRKLMPYITVATLLWFFIRLEILQSEHFNVLPNVMMFFFFGVIYYVADNMLSHYFSETYDNYHNLLFTTFSSIMPGNLFWGIGCFTLIVLFLLTTPDKIKTKKQALIWRLLALIPIFYLVFSYLYEVGISIWGWKEWPSYLSSLLFRKQFPTTVFAIFYPLFIYIYRHYVKWKYGTDNAACYFHGNRYFTVKNLIAATLVALIVLVNYLTRSTKIHKALGLNQTYWIAYLIPLMLFYHPHMGKRNPIVDNGITFIYLVSMSFAYAYLAEFLLFEVHLDI